MKVVEVFLEEEAAERFLYLMLKKIDKR
ncbi:hypothetical protein [Thermodesulfobacterium sp. TA1]